MKKQLIDNGFMLISEADAKKLSGEQLPKAGHEKLVFHEGQHYWLARTRFNEEMRWSIRETLWAFVNGRPTLGV